MIRRFKTISLSIILASFAFSTVSCSSDSPEEQEKSKEVTPFTRIPFTVDEKKAIDAAKPFGVDLFAKYSELSQEDNFIISPLSAIIDLGMLANGASGETQTEILEALGWGATGLENMNAYAQRLMTEYPNMDHTTDIRLVNGIFYRDDRVSLEKIYSDKMKLVYDADTQSLGADGWEQSISKWISDKSGGLIKDMDLGYKGSLVSLLNVLYFKGFWATPFDKENTISNIFTCSDGSRNNVDYLCDKRSVAVYQNEFFTCVSLPFGNHAYYIDFMLPDEERGLDACLQALNMQMWEDSWNFTQTMRVNLRIPKFELAHISNFNKSLQVLGIKKAFESGAELDRMLGNNFGDVKVSSVMQGCAFSIDEEGVTAASTTSVNIGETMPPPLQDGGDFFLDRPFVFAIRENSSGAILFMGKISKL